MTEKKVFYKRKGFLITAALLIGGIVFWNIYKYKIVDKKIDQLVTGKSNGLYQLTYDHLIIDEVLGNLSVENVSMIPDSVIYQSQLQLKTAPATLYYIRIPKLIITGVKTPKALLNKEIAAHVIRIENAAIEIRMGKSKKKDKPDFMQQMGPEMYQQLLGNLNSINADSVILENATLTLVDITSKIIKTKATGLSIRFAGIEIDSTKQNDSTRILFSKDLAIHCNKLEIPFKNKIYSAEVSGFDFSSVTGNIHTDEIRLKPALSEPAFAKSFKYAKDRMDIKIGALDIKKLNRIAYLNEELIAESLQISNASFHIFRDKSYPHDSVDRTHDYPQEAIMRLSIPVYIREIKVKDSYIEYKEKNDKSDSSGKVAFYNVQADLTNVTNMDDYIRKNNVMGLDFKSAFLNVSPFRANIRMKLDDKNGNFNMDASLGSINSESLNALLKSMALAELTKGKINSLNYHLDATNTHGNGRLVLKYQDLSIKLLKKDEDKNKYKKKFFPTLAAGLLLKGSNPSNGKTRIGNVDFERDIHRSMFNLMWKSLLSGIKQVAL